MLTVDEAIAAVTADVSPCPEEWVTLPDLPGRVLARDVVAALTQPPFAASAMDGYAVRAHDLRRGAPVRVIAEAPAGAPYAGTLGPAEAVRLYTGSVVPEGADYVLVQERAESEGGHIRASDDGPWPLARNNIRPAGCDFKKGDTLLTAGVRLAAVHGSLLAAANLDGAMVVGRPCVALFSNGSELVDPGGAVGAGQIVDSNRYALSAMIGEWGGDSRYLGRATDTVADAAAMFAKGGEADVILAIGGASVGDHDVVKPALIAAGGRIVFEGVSVKPGKPVWHGRLGDRCVIGLPGNPASAIVTAVLLLQPLVRRLAGRSAARLVSAVLTGGLPANGPRESWLRAQSHPDAVPPRVTPAASQDSSLMMPFARSAVLIRRAAGVGAAHAGDRVEVAVLDTGR